jgi:hypothetical protein
MHARAAVGRLAQLEKAGFSASDCEEARQQIQALVVENNALVARGSQLRAQCCRELSIPEHLIHDPLAARWLKDHHHPEMEAECAKIRTAITETQKIAELGFMMEDTQRAVRLAFGEDSLHYPGKSFAEEYYDAIYTDERRQFTARAHASFDNDARMNALEQAWSMSLVDTAACRKDLTDANHTIAALKNEVSRLSKDVARLLARSGM